MSLKLSEADMAPRRQTKQRPLLLGARHRIDLRADPAWLLRVLRQARRFGINLSAYIREAVTIKLELDEDSDPSFSDAS